MKTPILISMLGLFLAVSALQAGEKESFAVRNERELQEGLARAAQMERESAQNRQLEELKRIRQELESIRMMKVSEDQQNTR